MLDIAVVALVVICVLLGHRKGVLMALISLGAAVVALIGMGAAAPFIQRAVNAGSSVAASRTSAVVQLVCGLAIFISVSLAGRIFARRLGRDEEGDPLPWNRLLGSLAGLALGVVLGLLVLFAADTYAKMSSVEDTGRILEAVRSSRLVDAVSPYNPSDRYLVPELVSVLVAYRSDPEVMEDARNDPHLSELLSDPRVETALADRELRQAIESWDWQAIRDSSSLRALREDHELWERVFSDRTRKSLRELLAAARRRAEEREMEDPDAEGGNAVDGFEEPEAP